MRSKKYKKRSNKKRSNKKLSSKKKSRSIRKSSKKGGGSNFGRTASGIDAKALKKNRKVVENERKSIISQLTKMKTDGKIKEVQLYTIKGYKPTHIGIKSHIQEYTGQGLSDYRMSRPASERQFTGHGKSGMGRDPDDKMATGGRVGLRYGGLLSIL